MCQIEKISNVTHPIQRKLSASQNLNPTVILYLVSHGVLCHCGNYSNDTTYDQVYKYCQPNILSVNPLLVYYAF